MNPQARRNLRHLDQGALLEPFEILPQGSICCDREEGRGVFTSPRGPLTTAIKIVETATNFVELFSTILVAVPQDPPDFQQF